MTYEIIDGIRVPEPCTFDLELDDFTSGEFDIEKWSQRTGRNDVLIYLLKEKLTKYKYDVEQVELFGMQRDDYELKKQRCIEIVERLRTLEK